MGDRVNDAERIPNLRAALTRIAAGPCTGRQLGCKWSRTEVCPKHVAEEALIKDDWDAPLDEPGYTAEFRGLGAS